MGKSARGEQSDSTDHDDYSGFIDNEPDGVRIARVEGESLVTVVVPREKLAEAGRLPQASPERDLLSC